MAVKNAGENFDLTKDENILKINSPQYDEKKPNNPSMKGPHKVVYKSIEQRWAIVALLWDGIPRLGMRWFWSGSGQPFGNGFWATWLTIPDGLHKGILDSLQLAHHINPAFRAKIDDFLSGKISGEELAKYNP